MSSMMSKRSSAIDSMLYHLNFLTKTSDALQDAVKYVGAERAQLARALYDMGLSYGYIADHTSMSRARVQQLCEKARGKKS